MRDNHLVAGIPVDMVGGTSMGSFVGAAYAESGDVNKMCQKVREWSLVRACHTIYMLVTWSTVLYKSHYLYISTVHYVLAFYSLKTKRIVILRSGSKKDEIGFLKELTGAQIPVPENWWKLQSSPRMFLSNMTWLMTSKWRVNFLNGHANSDWAIFSEIFRYSTMICRNQTAFQTDRKSPCCL